VIVGHVETSAKRSHGAVFAVGGALAGGGTTVAGALHAMAVSSAQREGNNVREEAGACIRAAPSRSTWYHEGVARRALTGLGLAGALLALGCGASQGSSPPAVPPPVPGGSVEPFASLMLPKPNPPQPSEGPAPAATDEPGWLGVELALPPGDLAGVLVRDVMRDSPAQRAGLQQGDRILRIDAEPVVRPPDVVRIVSAHRAGERVGLVVQRAGADRLLAVLLDARPDQSVLMEREFLGAPAPAWKPLATVRGSVPSTLAELKGRVVVIEFWASWCVACRLSIPTLNAWKDRYGAQGLTVLGVTTDAPGLATEASIELGIDYAVLSDEDGDTSRVYRAMALPTLFVIDRDGTVRDVMVGYSSSRLAKAEAKVRELIGVAGAAPHPPG
jgi:thiol-disulfide isomerase/thioredoxin